MLNLTFSKPEQDLTSALLFMDYTIVTYIVVYVKFINIVYKV